MNKLSVTLKDDNGRDCFIENIRTFQKHLLKTKLESQYSEVSLVVPLIVVQIKKRKIDPELWSCNSE